MVAAAAFVTSILSHESAPADDRYRDRVTAMGLPPRAPQRPASRILHGRLVDDPYAWMRRTDDPDLIAYLAAENAWVDAGTAHLAALRATVESELRAVLPDEDASAPHRRGGYDYRVRRPAGAQYPVHVRRRAGSEGSDGTDEVLLDENELAEGRDFLEVGVVEPSPDGALLAYSVDVDGSEVYTLRVRDLRTGLDLPDTVPGTYYGLAWAADGASLLYTTLDDAYRPDRIRRHVLGRPVTEDTVVWHEEDRRFELEVDVTRSGELARLIARSRDTTEVRLVPTSDLGAEPTLVAGRVPGREYFVDHEPGDAGGHLVVLTDLDAPEYRVLRAPVAAPGTESWVELLAHDPAVRVESADAIGGYVVVGERHAGVVRVRVIDASGTTVRLVEPDAVGEVVRLADNHEQDVRAVRLVREGWVRPPAEVDHELATGAETVVHVQAVAAPLAGYRCETVHAVAADGTEVPISLVTRGRGPGLPQQPGPCLLYGYGAYESSLDPEFWPDMLPLLDRGVTFAVAHVRGGGELGRRWWQQGRLLTKPTTFTDFVSCARHLVRTGVTSPATLAARGRSAGGLLMGAVAHLAPETFAAIVAEVPFVDAVNTMLDDSLPLTVAEWDEWGDPRKPDEYACLASYSPYENTPGPRRPALLVTASRNDPRVSVHEPAKWVARIREEDATSPDAPHAPLFLRTALGGAAHTGPAGRYDAWRHEAFLHAFVLDAVGAAGDG
jgi:oligopeptidase B